MSKRGNFGSEILWLVLHGRNNSNILPVGVFERNDIWHPRSCLKMESIEKQGKIVCGPCGDRMDT